MFEGAASVTLHEGDYGHFDGSWVFCIHHESAEAWGKMSDKYSREPESLDNLLASWQKTPVLKFLSAGMLHYSEELSKQQ